MILRLGHEVLAGREMEREKTTLSSRFWTAVGVVFLLAGPWVLAFALFHRESGLFAIPAWKWLVAGMLANLGSRVLLGGLHQWSSGSVFAQILACLPMPGREVLAHARRVVLTRGLLWVPLLAFPLVWGVSDAPRELDDCVALLPRGLLVMALIYAQAMWMQSRLVSRVSFVVSCGVLVLSVLSIWGEGILSASPADDTKGVIDLFVWVYPAAWSFQGGVAAWVLMSVWIVIGLLRWLTMPQADGPKLDAPRDFFHATAESVALEDEEFGDMIQKVEEQAGEADPRTTAGVELLFHDEPAPQGWIERLAYGWFTMRERLLISFRPGAVAWTRQWWGAMRYGVLGIVLAAAWAWLAPVSAPKWLETLGIITCLILFPRILWPVFPGSSQLFVLPHAHNGLSACAMLPVTAREMIRASMKATAVRALACFIAVSAIFTAVTLLLGWVAHDAWLVMRLSAVLLVLLTLGRPLLIATRLLMITRKARRRRAERVLVLCLAFPAMALICVGTWFVSIPLTIAITTHTSNGLQAWGIILTAILVHSVCAQSAAALVLWHLRKNTRDWSFQRG
ncbi:MAG: hypothetical protein JNG86_18025 [Verrucomicrobiaceae bacterium]|nr:hypothetical protein [Verrucomicrobiaceae bacterium]